MARLNNAILSGDAESLLQELQAPTSTVKNIRTECGQDYLDSLRAAASERQDSKTTFLSIHCYKFTTVL